MLKAGWRNIKLCTILVPIARILAKIYVEMRDYEKNVKYSNTCIYRVT